MNNKIIDVNRVACWICHDDEPNGSGPLRRDCSCRGETGFAHLSCLVDYAKYKCQRTPKTFTEPWSFCPTCKQRYCNELALYLATTFVALAEEEYPNNELYLLGSLNVKIQLLLDPRNRNEVEQIANRMLAIIAQVQTESTTNSTPLLALGAQAYEARVYSYLGELSCGEGTKESARIALEHYEKCRGIWEALGDADGVTLAESRVAYAKVKLEGRNEQNTKEDLEKSKTTYNHFLQKYGQDNHETIVAGGDHARALYEAKRLIEAERLMGKVVPISRRVLGPEHDQTKYLEHKLQCLKMLQAIYEAERAIEAYDQTKLLQCCKMLQESTGSSQVSKTD